MIVAMVLGGIFILIVLVVVYLFLERTVLYPYDYTLKLTTGGTPIVVRTRAREIRKGENKGDWVLLYRKLTVPAPPAKVRAINAKGKYAVEAWLLSDGQIQYEYNQKVPVSYEEVGTPVKTDMFTSEQRIMLVNQFRRAEIEKGKNIKDFLMQIAMPLGMALILGGIIIFGMLQWSDINQPGLEFADKMVQLEAQRTEQLKILESISNDVQILKAREGLSDVVTAPQIQVPN
jgi:hypothetical protein